MSGKFRKFGLFIGIFAFAGVAMADGSASSSVNAGDTAWVLISAALVMLMTPAVGFFYGGMVRTKNVLSVMTQSFVILAIVSLLWVLIGYSLAFGPDAGGGLIGNLNWTMLNGVDVAPNPAYGATIPHLAFMIYQCMFAVITPALIIGAFADRLKFSTFILFIILWSVFVYAPIAHWVWGDGGWLKNLGVLDFAGGIVVHLSAGVSAIIAAIVIGRRVENKSGNEIRPHNITMTILGASLLWFGWFGFNAGSTLGANGLAARTFVVTNIAAAAAALSWMFISWWHTKKPSSLGVVTGAVCGLATITPASGYVSPAAALFIGTVAGGVCYAVVWLMKNRTKIDDALDVFACHGVGGAIGSILLGVFAMKVLNPAGSDGLLAGNVSLLESQLLAVLTTVLFAVVMTFVILKLLDKTVGLRVKREEEIVGLDLAQHGEEAYPDMEIPG